MDLSQALGIASLSVFVFISLFWLVSLPLRDTSIIDIGWGLGFAVIAWTLNLVVDERSAGFNILTLLVSVWGLRLGWHIFKRKAGSEEDWRYAQWRQADPDNWWWKSYFKVFVLQGVLMLTIAVPIMLGAVNATSFDIDPLVILGTALWLYGFYFEVVGDWQLDKFIAKKKKRKNPKKGKRFMTQGLWKYTRHPNYFGEIAQWSGIWIIVLSLPGTWWAIISPLTISYILLYVSMPMLENKYAGNKEWERYKKKTSLIIPRQPKSKKK